MNSPNTNYDIVIIGGGPAGLSAAYQASIEGAESILIIERDRELGGILQQCIHNGFGLHHFKEELTGPSYAERCYDMIKDLDNVDFLTDTMVINITEEKVVVASNPVDGLLKIQAKAIILAMGCRERTRGAIKIPGSRPAGVFTAGAAQRMVNMENALPGKKAVILGSGDIGLIMSRRLALEGVEVLACVELAPYSNGLTRNIVQCLEDYNIPLYLSHTIAKIHGNDRVTGVTVTKVDENCNNIKDSEFFIECDTLLLSVGLIPENELSKKLNIELDSITSGPIVDQMRQTEKEGIFAAGNVLHVHDLADFASEEAAIAGKYAALYVQEKTPKTIQSVNIKPGNDIRTVIPQKLSISDKKESFKLFIRVTLPKNNVKIQVLNKDTVILEKPIPTARPSEMIVLNIPENKVPLINDDLTIQLVGR